MIRTITLTDKLSNGARDSITIPSKLYRDISIEDWGVILTTLSGSQRILPWHRIHDIYARKISHD